MKCWKAEVAVVNRLSRKGFLLSLIASLFVSVAIPNVALADDSLKLWRLSDDGKTTEGSSLKTSGVRSNSVKAIGKDSFTDKAKKSGAWKKTFATEIHRYKDQEIQQSRLAMDALKSQWKGLKGDFKTKKAALVKNLDTMSKWYANKDVWKQKVDGKELAKAVGADRAKALQKMYKKMFTALKKKLEKAKSKEEVEAIFKEWQKFLKDEVFTDDILKALKLSKEKKEKKDDKDKDKDKAKTDKKKRDAEKNKSAQFQKMMDEKFKAAQKAAAAQYAAMKDWLEARLKDKATGKGGTSGRRSTSTAKRTGEQPNLGKLYEMIQRCLNNFRPRKNEELANMLKDLQRALRNTPQQLAQLDQPRRNSLLNQIPPQFSEEQPGSSSGAPPAPPASSEGGAPPSAPIAANPPSTAPKKAPRQQPPPPPIPEPKRSIPAQFAPTDNVDGQLVKMLIEQERKKQRIRREAQRGQDAVGRARNQHAKNKRAVGRVNQPTSIFGMLAGQNRQGRVPPFVAINNVAEAEAAWNDIADAKNKTTSAIKRAKNERSDLEAAIAKAKEKEISFEDQLAQMKAKRELREAEQKLGQVSRIAQTCKKNAKQTAQISQQQGLPPNPNACFDQEVNKAKGQALVDAAKRKMKQLEELAVLRAMAKPGSELKSLDTAKKELDQEIAQLESDLPELERVEKKAQTNLTVAVEQLRTSMAPQNQFAFGPTRPQPSNAFGNRLQSPPPFQGGTTGVGSTGTAFSRGGASSGSAGGASSQPTQSASSAGDGAFRQNLTRPGANTGDRL